YAGRHGFGLPECGAHIALGIPNVPAHKLIYAELQEWELLVTLVVKYLRRLRLAAARYTAEQYSLGRRGAAPEQILLGILHASPVLVNPLLIPVHAGQALLFHPAEGEQAAVPQQGLFFHIAYRQAAQLPVVYKPLSAARPHAQQAKNK